MYSDVSKRVARKEIMDELALLSASELEVIGHCVVCAIEGEPMAHRGLAPNNNPSGYTVDTFSNSRVVAAEYSTEQDYFEGVFAKLKTDAEHIRNELKNVSKAYFVSNGECRNSKHESAHQVVCQVLTAISPKDLKILSRRELANEIIERFVLGANQLSVQLADILTSVQRQRDLHVFELAVPSLPRTYVRDVDRYQALSERIKEAQHCVVWGLSGEGKTLAVADWVRVHADNYDHVLWIEGAAIPATMNFEAVPVARYGSKVNLASRLADGRTLLVVDDYEDSIESLIESASRYMSLNSRLLVTAQRVSSTRDSYIHFHGVSDTTAAEVLGVDVDNELRRVMSSDCSNLPLALGLIKSLKDEKVDEHKIISDLADLPQGEDERGQTITQRLMQRHVESLGQELAALRLLGGGRYESALLDVVLSPIRRRKLENRAMLIRDGDQYKLHKLVWNTLEHINLPNDSVTEVRFWKYVAENMLVEPRHFRVTLELQRDLIIQSAPNPPKPNLKALAYLKLDKGVDDKEFIEHLALNSEPDHEWFALAAWIEALEWYVRHSADNKKSALDAAKQLADVRPEDLKSRALVLHHRGKFLNLASRRSEAREIFESVLEIDPQFYQARLALARIERCEKRHDCAMSHLESILTVSRDSSASIGVSVVLAAYAETASHPSLQRKYISDDPEPFFDLYERSNVEGFDQPLRTLIAVGRALEYNAPNMMIKFAKRVHWPPEHEELSKRAAGDWGEFFLILAACSERVNDLEKRRSFASKAVKFLSKGPSSSFIATRTAKAYILCNQPQHALDALLNHDDKFALFYKAQAQSILGQNPDALKTISKALNIAQEKQCPTRYLWDFFRWRGKIEEALADTNCTASYRQAIELCPENAEDDLNGLRDDLARTQNLSFN